MIVKKIFCILPAALLLLAAQCNNSGNSVNTHSNKQAGEEPQPQQTENTFKSIDTIPGTTPELPGMNGDTVKVYYDFIKHDLDSFNRLIEKNPENGEYYQRRGDVRVSAGDYSGACEDYKKAKSLGIKNMQTLIEKNCK